MEEKKRYVRLGLFVIVSLAILLGMLFILGGRSLFQPKLTLETYFDQSVSGLGLGAPIQYRGVPLGQVTSITTSDPLYERDVPVERRRAYIVVRAELSGDPDQVRQWKRDVADHVRRGLRAQTQMAGVTGQQYLALDYFDPAKYPPLEFDWTPDYLYVPSVPSLTGQLIGNIQQFLASLNEIEIKDLGRNLNALVETLNRKIDPLPVAELSAQAMDLLKDARAMVQRADRVIAAAPVDQAVQKIASASARLDSLLANPGLSRTVDNAAAFTGSLKAIADAGSLDRVVQNLDRTIQRIDALVGDNQYDARVLVQDLRATADNLRTLSENAKRYPAGILFGAPPEKVALPVKESK